MEANTRQANNRKNYGSNPKIFNNRREYLRFKYRTQNLALANKLDKNNVEEPRPYSSTYVLNGAAYGFASRLLKKMGFPIPKQHEKTTTLLEIPGLNQSATNTVVMTLATATKCTDGELTTSNNTIMPLPLEEHETTMTAIEECMDNIGDTEEETTQDAYNKLHKAMTEGKNTIEKTLNTRNIKMYLPLRDCKNANLYLKISDNHEQYTFDKKAKLSIIIEALKRRAKAMKGDEQVVVFPDFGITAKKWGTNALQSSSGAKEQPNKKTHHPIYANILTHAQKMKMNKKTNPRVRSRDQQAKSKNSQQRQAQARRPSKPHERSLQTRKATPNATEQKVTEKPQRLPHQQNVLSGPDRIQNQNQPESKRDTESTHNKLTVQPTHAKKTREFNKIMPWQCRANYSTVKLMNLNVDTTHMLIRQSDKIASLIRETHAQAIDSATANLMKKHIRNKIETIIHTLSQIRQTHGKTRGRLNRPIYWAITKMQAIWSTLLMNYSEKTWIKSKLKQIITKHRTN